VIEVGSYLQHIFTGRVVRILEIKTNEIKLEWVLKDSTINMTYDKEFILTQFAQLTPLEVELL
jgi:hypothetical protein